MAKYEPPEIKTDGGPVITPQALLPIFVVVPAVFMVVFAYNYVAAVNAAVAAVAAVEGLGYDCEFI